MDFNYKVSSKKSFVETVKVLQEEIVKAGMRVLHVHDIQKALGEKGFQREPFKIIEFCSARYAYNFLNLSSDIGLFLPCKIVVFQEDNQVFVSALRPLVLNKFFPELGLQKEIKEINEVIHKIVEAVL
jgi:uncharacterized protein (DUF302 family)